MNLMTHIKAYHQARLAEKAFHERRQKSEAQKQRVLSKLKAQINSITQAQADCHKHQQSLQALEDKTQQLALRIVQMQNASQFEQASKLIIDKSKLEDELLEAMETQEKLIDQVNQEHQTAEKIKHQLALLQTQHETLIEDIHTRLDEYKNIIAKYQNSLSPEHLSQYEKLWNATDGTPVATIDAIDMASNEFACSECHLSLPFSSVSQLLSSTTAPTICTHCLRMLILSEEIQDFYEQADN